MKSILKALPLLATLLVPSFANAQLFSQDFSSSTNLPDYVGAPPNNMQFDVLGSSGSGVVASITSGKLQFVRTTANAGGAIRNTDFSSTPVLLKAEFDLDVPAATTSTTTAAQFYFGDGLNSNLNAGDAGATFHTKIGINLVNGGGFQLRNIGGAVNSATFLGEHKVTIVSNNSGSSSNYTGPDGTTNAVSDDKIDVWAGNTLVFNDMNANAAGAGTNLSEFKFIFSNGSGTITLDNILIDALTPLPVRLEHIYAESYSKVVEIAWRTATERNSHFFSVERSADGRLFSEIGRLPGAGTSFGPQDYTFTDEAPLPGLNYYRLRQVDFDGFFQYSPVVTAVAGQAGDIRLYPSPAADILIVQLEKSQEETLVWEVFDQAGRLLLKDELASESTDFEINTTALPAGVYTLRLAGGRESHVGRFQKK